MGSRCSGTHEHDIAQFAKRVLVFRDGHIRKDDLVLNRPRAAEVLKSLPTLEDEGSQKRADGSVIYRSCLPSSGCVPEYRRFLLAAFFGLFFFVFFFAAFQFEGAGHCDFMAHMLAQLH